MQALIISGGTIEPEFAKSYIGERDWDYIISADAGMKFCKEAEILPDLLMGDFDSAEPEVLSWFQKQYPERMRRFPAQKDETDTELAILQAIAQGADSVTIIGGTGTRLDHVLGNIQLLKMALDKGVNCLLVDSHNRIRMIRDTFSIRKAEQFGTYVSLLPFTPQVRGLTLHGFAYEVSDYTLSCGLARGVSNEIEADTAVIELKEGLLLVVESRD